MDILLLFTGSILFILVFVFWQHGFQRNIGEMSSNSTALVPVRASTSTGSSKSDIGSSLTVIGLSQDTLINSPQSVVMHKRILVNLRVVEYKLAELEHLLGTRHLDGACVNCECTGMLSECTDSEDTDSD